MIAGGIAALTGKAIVAIVVPLKRGLFCRSPGILCSNIFPANCFIGQQLGHCNCCWTKHEGQHLLGCHLLVHLLLLVWCNVP